MKRKIYSLLLTLSLLMGVSSWGFYVNASSEETIVDYEKLYIDYFSQNDKSASNGFVITELNGDDIPELFLIYVANSTEGISRIVYNYMYSIEDGKVVEHTTQIDGNVMYSNYLPNSDVQTDLFVSVFKEKMDHHKELISYYLNEANNKEMLVSVTYDGSKLTLYEDEYSPAYMRAFEESKEVICYQLYQTRDFKASQEETLIKLFEEYNSQTYVQKTYQVSDWASEEVKEAIELNLVPEEMFNDDLTEEITRAEFSAIAVKLYQAVTNEDLYWNEGYIVDILENDYQEYIRGAYYLGITNGIGMQDDGGVIFAPDLCITREQLATMLARTIKVSVYPEWHQENDSEYPLDISGVTKFADDAQISEYANEAVYYMSKKNIIKGMDETHFAPAATATKEQAILLALRIYNSRDNLGEIDWKQKYTSFILENKDYYTTDYNHVNYIGVNDLNFDGVPDLILSDGAASAADSIALYTIKDGNVVCVIGTNWICQNHEYDHEKVLTDDGRWWARYDKGWLTLRKNKETGELRYVMELGNGSDSESFGNIISIAQDPEGIKTFNIINEFEYTEIYDEGMGYEPTEERYLVKDVQVADKAEYDSKLAEFNELWEDTGVVTQAMTSWYEADNYTKVVLEEGVLIDLFSQYKPEY